MKIKMKTLFQRLALLLFCVFAFSFGGCFLLTPSSSSSSEPDSSSAQPTPPVYEYPVTISFLGDSITYGGGPENEENYCALLAKDENFIIRNYGVNGANISGHSGSSYTKRYTQIDKESDIIFVFGGTNDYGSAPGQGVTLGKMSDDTIDTFYGALDVLIKGIESEYPEAKLCFITPLKRDNAKWGYPDGELNEFGYTLEDYRNAIVEKCEAEGLEYLDLFNETLPAAYFVDGLHPNAAGNAALEQYIGRFLDEKVFQTVAPAVDNTEASKNHDKLYYYSEDNVPYDKRGRSYKYCFITPYLAAKPTGGAVLVFPGGGYSGLSNGDQDQGSQIEAGEIAGLYNAAGISVFVVHYRVASHATTVSVNYRSLLSDGTRAMRYVRHNAEKFHVDPDKIGVMGFSAGGHLAGLMTVESGYSWKIDDADYIPDEIDNVSAKANAGVFGYGVLSFEDGATHEGTRKQFTRDDTSLYELYSPDKQVTADTAPCFIWYEWHDSTVPGASSRNFEKALRKAGVRYETHFYQDLAPASGVGSDLHGMGLAHNFAQANEWPELSAKFLQSLGF